MGIRTILFSPVGGTDPVYNQYDGAMIHIARYYKPDKIILYLSKEMLDFHKQDNRYCNCIEQLGNTIDYHFETELIERPDLVDVHKFDFFYNEFENELAKLTRTYPEAEILLNVTSGTPAMIAALQTIAALSDGKFTAVQVHTPERKMNRSKHEGSDNFDSELIWECNLDNGSDAKNRCESSPHRHLLDRVKREILFQQLDSYNYYAALDVAKTMQVISPYGRELIEAACCRVQLNQGGVTKIIDKIEKTYIDADIQDAFKPVKQSNKSAVFEYLLWLQMKEQRKDYADFLRGITPVVANLFNEVLQKEGLQIAQYCSKEGKNKLKRELLKKDAQGREWLQLLDERFDKQYSDSPLSSELACIWIEGKCSNEELKKNCEIVRNAERKVRNIAAHEMQSVTEEWVQQKCGLNPHRLMGYLWEIAHETNYWTCKSQKKSYDDMNKVIKKQFEPIL